jgi:cell division protein ZapA
VNQIEVQIMGQSYLLGCPEGGEDKLRAAVQRVDEAMCRIRDAGKVRARDRIAVLAALNLAFDLSDKASDSGSAEQAASGFSAESESQALRALLDRLDDALNEDGQLL